jgi:uncharacterized protein (TIGR02996 family)
MDHENFLQAIVADPDDDTPRLIYADWLEEHGNPHGRFIRVQCALERFGLGDPRRLTFEDEAEDLLAAHEEEWTARLRGGADNWTFRRGFVEDVAADGETFLANANAWFAAFPLRRVCLRLPTGLMPALARDRHLVQLESLAFRGHFLRDRELRELLASPYLNRLTALDLREQGIETGGVRALAESPLISGLQLLDLGNNRAVGDQAVRALAAASGAASLRTLKLGGTNLTARGVNDLFGSVTLSALRELDLSSVQWRDLSGFVESMARSPVLGKLTALNLARHPLPLTELQRLLSVLGRPGFLRLGLSDCRLEAGSAEALAATPFGSLEALDLSRNRIGSDGARALAESSALANLTELHLGWTDVRDTGVKAIASSPHLTRLTVLDLAHNEIGGPGLRALVASPNVVGLRDLDLSSNYVNHASVEALANAPNLSRLRSLKLNGNRLGQKETAVFAASPHLTRHLKVEMNEESAEAEVTRAYALIGYERRA